MYKPLPDTVTIRNSEIQGLGLFAVEPIKEGTEIGLSHFYWGDQLQRTPLGAFYNHSSNPNIIKTRKDSRYFIVATRDIMPDEEITCEYTFYNITERNQ